MITLCIDPGARGSGCALFKDDELLAAAYIRNPVTDSNQVVACVGMARAIEAWVALVLKHPPLGPWSAVWRWFRDQMPTSTWTLFGVNAPEVVLPDVVVLEWPRMYQSAKQKGDQNDLPPLAGVDCAVGALFPGAELVSVFPDEWKQGQVPKKVMNDRVWERLSPEERARVESCGAMIHNVLDGCGLGLWRAGRLRKTRSYGE